jgi:ABC-type lipoprotein release transport system permease subunit
VISSVAVGVFAIILAMGLINGIMTQMVENTINTSLGHLSIQRKGFQGSMRLQHAFVPGDDIARALKDSGGMIQGHAPRVRVKGMVRSSESSRGVLIVGIDPMKERDVSYLFNYTSKEAGSSFLGDPAANDILISKGMADKMELVPGDKLVLMVQDAKGGMVGTGMTVRGVFRTPVDAFDRYTVFTGIDRLRELTGTAGRVSEINVVLKNRNSAGEAKKKISAMVTSPGMDVLTWQEMAPSLVGSIMIVDALMYVSFFIIFITIIFSIANTLVMAIMERFHEIGVMKSIGTGPRWIFLMVLFESMNLGFLGLGAGLVLGIAVTGILGATGVDLSVYSETMRAMGSGSVIYPAVRAFDIFMATIIVLFTTFSAAIYPARKAARIEPVEALTFI